MESPTIFSLLLRPVCANTVHCLDCCWQCCSLVRFSAHVFFSAGQYKALSMNGSPLYTFDDSPLYPAPPSLNLLCAVGAYQPSSYHLLLPPPSGHHMPQSVSEAPWLIKPWPEKEYFHLMFSCSSLQGFVAKREITAECVPPSLKPALLVRENHWKKGC